MLRNWKELSVVCVLAGLLAWTPEAALAQRTSDEVTQQWVEVFKPHQIDRATLEQILGKPLTEMTRDDSQKLQGLLATARANAARAAAPDFPGQREAKAADFLPNEFSPGDFLPITAEEAVRLRDAVLKKEGPYDATFNELADLIGRMPKEGPPAEKLAIDKLIEFWSKFKEDTKKIRDIGPQAATAANDYRTALTEGMTKFQAIDDDGFADLTLLKEAGQQAFRKRLEEVNARMRGWQDYKTKMETMDRYIDRTLAMLSLMRGIADAADREDQFRKVFEEHARAFERFSQMNREFAQKILDGSKGEPSPGDAIEPRPLPPPIPKS